MLFIDHDQAEFSERQPLLDKCMGATMISAVHSPARSFSCGPELPVRKSQERPSCSIIPVKVKIMLFGKGLGRCHKRCLIAAFHGIQPAAKATTFYRSLHTPEVGGSWDTAVSYHC